MSEEISPELKKQGQEAYDNNTDYYICNATGNTYPVKDRLQSWGFFWVPEKKCWTAECVSAWEKFLFERYVADGEWTGVKLEFSKDD
jgi:hypothetical protein